MAGKKYCETCGERHKDGECKMAPPSGGGAGIGGVVLLCGAVSKKQDCINEQGSSSTFAHVCGYKAKNGVVPAHKVHICGVCQSTFI